jgi:hypothetical protein
VDTDLKSNIVASPEKNKSRCIVRGFNEEELEQWKVGVRSGVEKNN